MPLPTMPMSIVRWSSEVVTNAPSTPAAPPSSVTIATSAKRTSAAPSVEPGLKPNQPMNRITVPRPTSGIEWPGMAQRGAVVAVLAAARPEHQQRGEPGGRFTRRLPNMALGEGRAGACEPIST